MVSGIAIWDLVLEKYWEDDEDGELFLFKDETAARNFMYTMQYTYEYMTTGVEFHHKAEIDREYYHQ